MAYNKEKPFNDWFILTSISETAQLTTKKIRKILELRDQLEPMVKETLKSSFDFDLLQLMFTLPYLKIDLLVRKKIAHHQTASAWLKKLASVNILETRKMGRTTYFINWRLIDLLAPDELTLSGL